MLTALLNSGCLQDLMTANTIGMSIIQETLVEAGKYVMHRSGVSIYAENGRTYKEMKSCFLFVEGTGLEMIVKDFNLGYDPIMIKREFNNYFGLREYL